MNRSITGLMNAIGPSVAPGGTASTERSSSSVGGTSTTNSRQGSPTCGAASPMPSASYMRSIIRSTAARTSSVTRSTGDALVRRTPAG